MKNNKVEKKNKSKTLFTNIKVRLELLKIWVIKNIFVFIKLGIIIGVILVLCGIIDNSIPVLGEISQEFENLAKADSWQIAVKSFGVIASILVSVFIFVKRTKRLAIEDIKTKKLKIALLKANLYFDENGRLRKKPKSDKVNIDEEYDTGISNLAETPKENLVEGVVRATSELGLILTTEIESNEAKVVQEAQLTPDSVDDETIEEDSTTEAKDKKVKKNKRKIKIISKFINSIKKFFSDIIIALKHSKFESLVENEIETEKHESSSKLEEPEKEKIEIVSTDKETVKEADAKDTILSEEKVESSKAVTQEDKTISDLKDIVSISTTEQKISKMRNNKKINDILNSLK